MDVFIALEGLRVLVWSLTQWWPTTVQIVGDDFVKVEYTTREKQNIPEHEIDFRCM